MGYDAKPDNQTNAVSSKDTYNITVNNLGDGAVSNFGSSLGTNAKIEVNIKDRKRKKPDQDRSTTTNHDDEHDVSHQTLDHLLQRQRKLVEEISVIGFQITKSQATLQFILFFTNYKRMDPSKKWTIKSNAAVDKDLTVEGQVIVVEDVVFEGLKTKDREYLETSLLACFVADMRNDTLDRRTLKGWFGEKIFDNICSKVIRRLPQIPSNINELIDSFNSTDEKHIRAQLAKLLLDTPDVSNISFVYREWLVLVITKFLQLCRQRLLEKTDWSEHWYFVNIWGPVVDTLLQSIDGMTFHRYVVSSPFTLR